MNTKQRTTLLIGTVLFLLMGLFPPWQYSLKTISIVSRDAGFDFILSSPEVSPKKMSDIFGLPNLARRGFDHAGQERVTIASFEAQINTSQLLLQWLMLLGTCAGLFLLLRTPTKGVNKPVETVPRKPDEPAQSQDTVPLEEPEDHLDTVKEKPFEEPEEVVSVERSLVEPEDHKSRQQPENQKDKFVFNLVAAILGGFALIFLVYLGTPDRRSEVTSVRKEAARAARVEATPENSNKAEEYPIQALAKEFFAQRRVRVGPTFDETDVDTLTREAMDFLEQREPYEAAEGSPEEIEDFLRKAETADKMVSYLKARRQQFPLLDEAGEFLEQRRALGRPSIGETDRETLLNEAAEFLKQHEPYKMDAEQLTGMTIEEDLEAFVENLEAFLRLENDAEKMVSYLKLRDKIATELARKDEPKTTYTSSGGGELFASIFMNWIIGLGPAVFFRLFGGPFSKRKAKITTGIIGFCLFLLVSLVSHGMGTTPNMAPVAVWIFATYAILRYRSAPANTPTLAS